MKIVDLKELSRMPNGTVFSQINSKYCKKYRAGDFDIDGLNIMCGHDDKYCPVESGRFNGVLHMLNYVPVRKGLDDKWYLESDYSFADYGATDTVDYDYDKDDMFVVYDKTDVVEIINVLQWALTGCESDLLVRSEFVDYD